MPASNLHAQVPTASGLTALAHRSLWVSFVGLGLVATHVARRVLRASDGEVNAPEETHLEVVRNVAAVCPTPRRWIDVRAVI